MTTITESFAELRGSIGRKINWQLFLQDNITGSWIQTVWILFFTLITVNYTIGQIQSLPLTTIIVLILWVIGIALVVVGELRLKHTAVSRWLKENLLTSVSNTLLTLFISLILVSAVNGILTWAFIHATFVSPPPAPALRPDNGANWGVIWGARKLLLTGLLAPTLSWRVWTALGFIVVMWLLSFISNRPSLKAKLRFVRLATNIFWLLSPIILYIFLAGVPDTDYDLLNALTGYAVLLVIYLLLWWQKVIQFSWKGVILTSAAWPVLYTIWWLIGKSGTFSPINVDDWGGLLLTLIIASAVIVLSLPFGIILALGRRSEVYGIPAWILWPAAILVTVWGFTTTPELLATSRNTIEQILAFWPVAILGLAFFIHNSFKGNMVAGASTMFIELIRSVPLITLLFMGIVMAPFFFGQGVSIAKPWPVIVGYAFFSSAYMAETIRGGLQAIPKGQYEAADALGFNSLQKMRFIIMPQALRIVIPPIVGQFIGAFKSSSLVSIVGLFDLLGIQKAILANAQWQGLRLELYVFLALVYFIGSFVMSSYSRRLETRLSIGDR
jgi:general L-amino acid transport system permease protein